eukprot:TRINITY_DN130_c0_g4_i2.p1 TRINITY_DN130_c0_g4~~TRINITY_DN130_c0_g4_i2.p1  ORF type:complete len:274 (+),score=62.99 TRINITY_DN130_c0_g4_i2:68-823(+)
MARRRRQTPVAPAPVVNRLSAQAQNMAALRQTKTNPVSQTRTNQVAQTRANQVNQDDLNAAIAASLRTAESEGTADAQLQAAIRASLAAGDTDEHLRLALAASQLDSAPPVGRSTLAATYGCSVGKSTPAVAQAEPPTATTTVDDALSMVLRASAMTVEVEEQALAMAIAASLLAASSSSAEATAAPETKHLAALVDDTAAVDDKPDIDADWYDMEEDWMPIGAESSEDIIAAVSIATPPGSPRGPHWEVV